MTERALMAHKKTSQRSGQQLTEQQVADTMRLSELRKRVGLTQAEVAKVMGVSQSSISQLESQGDIQISTLSDFARALGGRLRLVVDLPGGSIALEQFRSRRIAIEPKRKAARSHENVQPAQGEATVRDLKQFIVKYEMLGEDLQRIVNLYNQQRSEEVIEDIEAEIEKSHDQRPIYDAINQSIIDTPSSQADESEEE